MSIRTCTVNSSIPVVLLIDRCARLIHWSRSWLDLPPNLLCKIAPAYGGIIHHFSKPFVGVSCTNTLILENLDRLVEACLIVSARAAVGDAV